MRWDWLGRIGGRGIAIGALAVAGGIAVTAAGVAFGVSPWAAFIVAILLAIAAVGATIATLRHSQGRQAHPGLTIDGWREVARELERSRRHERPFTVIRSPVGDRDPDASTAWCVDMLQRLQPTIRQLDTIWASGDAVWLLMPESSRSEAEQLLARIARIDPGAGLAESASMASFPEDAITGTGIRRLLEERRAAPIGDMLTPPAAGGGLRAG